MKNLWGTTRELPEIQVQNKVDREEMHKRLNVKITEQPSDMRAAISGGSGPEQGSQGDKGKDAQERKLGLALRPLTPELARQLGYEGLSGVLIAAVKPGSVAEQANMRPRALIREVDKKPVRDIAEFRKHYGKVPSGRHVLFLLQFERFTQYIAVKKP